MKRRRTHHAAVLAALLSVLLPPGAALAHHGIASLGVAGIAGPGAPLETSSSQTLGRGSWLAYVKIDQPTFETFTLERDRESDRSTFMMFGLGYGVRSWLSAYAFLPFHAKNVQDNSTNTAGFADASFAAVVGLRWDGRLRPVPANESLDDLEDLHFTVSAGGTLPTGDENLRDRDGVIDPGLSLGFGGSSWNCGLTATKVLAPRWTAVAEASVVGFTEHTYADGARVRFGREVRLNAALVARVLTCPAAKTRLDLNAEANYLTLGRDETAGLGETATGGRILYGVGGLRLTRSAVSLGLGWKAPVWTALNEDALQQGAVGKENGRLIATLSCLF
jgi:hypothetical protein